MKELTFGTLIAVLEEIFGAAFFWAMVIAAGVILIAYVYVLIRDRSLSMRKFFWAQVTMPLGAVGAVAVTLWATNSGLTDIGGPIDVIVFLGIAAFGAVGIAVLVYTVESLVWPAPPP